MEYSLSLQGKSIEVVQTEGSWSGSGRGSSTDPDMPELLPAEVSNAEARAPGTSEPGGGPEVICGGCPTRPVTAMRRSLPRQLPPKPAYPPPDESVDPDDSNEQGEKMVTDGVAAAILAEKLRGEVQRVCSDVLRFVQPGPVAEEVTALLRRVDEKLCQGLSSEGGGRGPRPRRA